ncbi:MAG: 3-isopropylmalate dehydratase [candidate division NC10 bacterium]|nr:3-isopropylmalate dehydratase [candidate division NC10 bacterium]
MGLVMDGRVWVFGDHINTDLMCPGAYQWGTWEEIRPHVLEACNPRFPKEVGPGDVIIAGRNFGCGSSREKAPKNLKHLGIRCVVAESFGRLFFRNCIAIGLPILPCGNVASRFETGDRARIDVEQAVVENCTRGLRLTAEPLSREMIDTLREGGIIALLRK